MFMLINLLFVCLKGNFLNDDATWSCAMENFLWERGVRQETQGYPHEILQGLAKSTIFTEKNFYLTHGSSSWRWIFCVDVTSYEAKRSVNEGGRVKKRIKKQWRFAGKASIGPTYPCPECIFSIQRSSFRTVVGKEVVFNFDPEGCVLYFKKIKRKVKDVSVWDFMSLNC